MRPLRELVTKLPLPALTTPGRDVDAKASLTMGVPLLHVYCTTIRAGAGWTMAASRTLSYVLFHSDAVSFIVSLSLTICTMCIELTSMILIPAVLRDVPQTDLGGARKQRLGI